MNPLWLLLAAAEVLLWLHLSSWAVTDARGVNVDAPTVATVGMGIGAVGVVLTFFVHAAFAFLGIAMVATAAGVYIGIRNKRVPEVHRILGPYHRAQLLSLLPGVDKVSEYQRARSIQAEGAAIRNEQGQSLGELTEQHPELEEASRVLTDFILRAYGTQSSSVRLIPADEQYVTQFRMDGFLYNVESFEPTAAQAVLALSSLFAGTAETGKIRKGAGRILAQQAGEELEIETKITSIKGKPALVLNFPDWKPELYKEGLAALGMHASIRKRVRAAVGRESGAAVFSGPPGSGRTTTLWAAAGEVDIYTTEIICFGADQERRREGVRQWPIDEEKGWDESFAALLREDPNAVMYDGIKEPSRAGQLFDFAAERGLLMATTEGLDPINASLQLKSLAANGAAERALTCVLSQRLIRTLCPECKEEVEPNPRLLRRLKLDPEEPGTWYRPLGCEACLGSGYHGRTAIYGMLIITDAVREALTAPDATVEKVRSAAGQAALRTMYRDGITKTTAGLTTLEEVRRVLQKSPSPAEKVGE